MPNPHLDYGVPWTISTPTTPPVSTGTPNFGPPGTGGNNQPPPPQVTTPVSTGTPNFGPPGTGGANQPPLVVNTIPTIDDNTTSNIGGALHGEQEFVPVYPGLGEEGGTTYDMLDVMQDLSLTHGSLTNPDGTPTKYGKSWDFNPANPDNLIGMDTHTLGSFIVTDSSGNPVLDSEGKPIFTSLGQNIHNQMQDEGLVGPNQQILPEDMPALQDFVHGLSYEDIHGMEDDFWRDYTAPGGEGGYEERTDYYDPRQETFDKLRFLQAGLPQRGMEQSGFFGEMTDPYSADVSEALNKGIFSGAMRQGVFDPKGLRRLITSFGSGVTKPRYANIARGGIVSLVGE